MDIYEEITRLRREGRRGALATIINVRGSIPSFESAKMLVRDDGSIVGTIGGGCVEAEVWEAAREAMKTEKPQTLLPAERDVDLPDALLCRHFHGAPCRGREAGVTHQLLRIQLADQILVNPTLQLGEHLVAVDGTCARDVALPARLNP